MKKLHYERFNENRFIPSITHHDWSKIYFADLECVTKETEYFKVYNKTTIHFGYIENAQKDSGFLFKTLGELFSWFNHNRKKQHIIIYFHNLGFDGSYILSFLDSLKKHRALNSVNRKQPVPTITFTKKDSHIYSIKVWNPIYETLIEFRCSWVLLTMPLKQMGKIIGLEKMDVDTIHVEYQKNLHDYPQEFKDYCIRDVKVLKRGFIHFYKLFKDYNMDLLEGFTISQLSYQNLLYNVLIDHNLNYNNELCEQAMDEFIHIDKPSYEIGKNFYRGGFTQFVNLGEGIYKIDCSKNGVKIDINSSYPYAMTKLLPYGQIHNLKDEPLPHTPHLKYYEIKIHKSRSIFKQINTMYNWAKHTNDYVYLDDISSSYIYKEEYVQELEDCVAYYFEEELEVMKKYNYIEYEVLNTYWFHAECWAKKWVQTLYQIKADPNTPKALKQVVKLMLNSAYGKFGQNPLQDEYYAVKDKETKQKLLNQEDGEYHYWDTQEPFEHFQLVKRKKTSIDDDQKIKHIWVASTITSYARIHLLKTLYHIGVEYFVYCDTDSLILKDPMIWEVLPFLDETQLGKWKDESQENGGINEVWILGKKCYVVFYNNDQDERKFSGVDKEFLNNLTRNELEDVFKGNVKILKGAKKTHEWTIGGTTIENVDFQINTRGH